MISGQQVEQEMAWSGFLLAPHNPLEVHSSSFRDKHMWHPALVGAFTGGPCHTVLRRLVALIGEHMIPHKLRSSSTDAQ